MYAKLFTSIYQGTLRGNSHGLLVFTNLLAHADKEGVADIHPRAISEEVGLSVDQVRVAIGMLESPDEESRSPEEQGRRIVRMDEHRAWGWRVVNYLKYRAIRDEDDRREQNRLSQAKWREKNKPASSSVITSKPDKPKSAHTEADTEADTDKAPKPSSDADSPDLTVKDLIAEGIDSEVAKDWLRVRKDKKARLTRTAWDAVKREACIAGLTPAQAVKISAENTWQGFKASWLTDKRSNGRSSSGDIYEAGAL